MSQTKRQKKYVITHTLVSEIISEVVFLYFCLFTRDFFIFHTIDHSMFFKNSKCCNVSFFVKIKYNYNCVFFYFDYNRKSYLKKRHNKNT